jgi:hypothetical protein
MSVSGGLVLDVEQRQRQPQLTFIKAGALDQQLHILPNKPAPVAAVTDGMHQFVQQHVDAVVLKIAARLA